MPDHFYVYPAYLTRGRSRSKGRRVPEGETLVELTADEIVQAAKRLGCRAEVEADKQFPRDVPASLGRVKVTKSAGYTKAKFLRAVAAELAKQRALGGKR
ncbi:MAG: signal recognition particle subunit SRP19/SEC65 family protein [Thermoplasmata archaeon]|jgi:signal recognition particle subunit SEC65